MRPRDGGLVTHGVWAMRDDDARTTEIWPRDGGLVAHGVRAMRDDNGSGQQAVSHVKNHFFFERERNM